MSKIDETHRLEFSVKLFDRPPLIRDIGIRLESMFLKKLINFVTFVLVGKREK